jgi:hypothetical protein
MQDPAIGRIVMEILGRREQPRLLVIGVDENTDLAAHISGLAPTTKFLLDLGQIRQIRQRDWDAAILWNIDLDLAPHLFVLQFGGSRADTIIDTPDLGAEIGHGELWTFSTEFKIAEDLPAQIARLTRSELAPHAMGKSRSATIGVRTIRYRDPPTTPDINEVFSAFLLDGDDAPIAGRYRRGNDSAEWWILPEDVPNPERWIAAALDEWRAIAPDVFPGEAVWTTRPEWRTPDETEIAAETTVLESRWADAVRAHDEAIAALEVRRLEAEQHADENERRLLTAQGADLVEEVIACLTDLGFDVIDVDKEVAQPGDLREDIRVTAEDTPDWIAIGEIRGYGRGAQLNDLLRLGRFVVRFVRDEGKEPNAIWYVVNHFRETDPTTRPAPLEANQAEVDTFAESGGVVIDTRDLFRLRNLVATGLITTEAARRSLQQARGRPDSLQVP